MISEFRGINACYSNFFLILQVDVIPNLGHVRFPSNEHYFQSWKASMSNQFIAIANAPTPGIAKRMGSPKGYRMPNGEMFRVNLRPDWNDIKIGIMTRGLWLKFNQNRDLYDILVASAPQVLQEGNWWKDEFWGVNLRTGRGENWLGRLLMDLRGQFILAKMPVNHKLPI